MAYTAGDHVKEFRSRFPACPPNEALYVIQQAWRDLVNESVWKWRIKEARINTEAPYSTGTVAVTNGSTSVVLTSGTWDASWTNRKIFFEGDEAHYSITINTATTGTLSEAFQGATLTAGTYTMYRDVYTLPSDCDMGEQYYLIDPSKQVPGGRIDWIEMGQFLDEKMRQGWDASGIPEKAVLLGVNSSGLQEFQLGPYAPSVALSLVLIYFAGPAAITSLSTVPTPRIPVSFEDMVWRRAVWQYAAHPRRRHPQRYEFRDEYYQRWAEAKAKLDGSNEMERILKTRYPWTLSGISVDDYAFRNVEYVGD